MRHLIYLLKIQICFTQTEIINGPSEKRPDKIILCQIFCQSNFSKFAASMRHIWKALKKQFKFQLMSLYASVPSM